MSSCTSVVLILSLCGACSKSKDEGDRTREPAKPAATMPSTAPVVTELPQVPKEELRGNVRVINLLLDKDGKPVTVDIWGRRTFTWAPMQFATNVAYGTASDWYGVPKGMSTVAVPAGGGADAKELATLWGPQSADEEASTVVFRNNDAVSATLLPGKPHGKNNAPDAPPTGKGFVYVVAWQLMPHEATLTSTYGGRSFYVGDGAGACVHQRVEDKGFARAILGGTQGTEHDLPPGKATFTLHKWPGASDQECAATSKVFDFTVDVVADQGVLVLLHTRDGKTIETLQLPRWK